MVVRAASAAQKIAKHTRTTTTRYLGRKMSQGLKRYRRSLISKLTGAQRRIDENKRFGKNYKAEFEKLVLMHALQAVDDYMNPEGATNESKTP
jgi:hypothetical protein